MSRLPIRILFAFVWMPLLAVAQAPAQTPTASTPTGPAKLAWINLEQAILTTEEGKNMIAEVQKYVDAKNSELDAARKELDGLKNQLNVQGPKLTDEARTELEEQIESKDTGLQRFQQDTQKDIENRRVKIANYVGKRMMPVVEKVAKERGYSAILILNQNRDAYIDPGLMVTEDIVKAYNQAYPPSAPKAPAAGTPAKKP
jgi:outer membrane protein